MWFCVETSVNCSQSEFLIFSLESNISEYEEELVSYERQKKKIIDIRHVGGAFQ